MSSYPDPLPSPGSEDFARHLVSVGRQQARRAGVRHDSLDDCALEFASHLLRYLESKVEPPGSAEELHLSSAWLYRCARNFALNFRQVEATRSARERPWPEEETGPGQSRAVMPPEACGQTHSPEALLLLLEFRQRLDGALSQLSVQQRMLLVQFHVHAVDIQTLASATGRTPHAIKQALSYARRRLRLILEREELGDSDLQEYFEAIYRLTHSGF